MLKSIAIRLFHINEFRLFPELIQFVKQPQRFLRENKYDYNTCLRFATLVVKISAIIDLILFFTITNYESELKSHIVLYLTIAQLLFSRTFASVFLFITTHIFDWVIRLVANKSQVINATRLFTLVPVFSLVKNCDFKGSLYITISLGIFQFYLYVYGASKQYGISWKKSLLAVIFDVILGIGLTIVFFWIFFRLAF